MQLNLKRPLVFFDLETTGTNVEVDRIIEICMIKVMPDGSEEERVYRINPEQRISEAATKVHGISNADVDDKPTFKQLAPEIYEFLRDCDWAGYNSNRFDAPMLVEEFFRAGIKIDTNTINMIDVQNIFYKKEPRTLVAALRFYCNEELENAHSALADTRATYNVLKAQLDRYSEDGDIQNDVASLANYTRMSKNVDLAGRFVYNSDGKVEFNFGQHKGKLVSEVLRQNAGYYAWFMEKDFSENTKDVLRRIYCQMNG